MLNCQMLKLKRRNQLKKIKTCAYKLKKNAQPSNVEAEAHAASLKKAQPSNVEDEAHTTS